MLGQAFSDLTSNLGEDADLLLMMTNSFAYAVNNPVNVEDENGYWPKKSMEKAYIQAGSFIYTTKKFIDSQIIYFRNKATASFWKSYYKLSAELQTATDNAFEKFKLMIKIDIVHSWHLEPQEVP